MDNHFRDLEDLYQALKAGEASTEALSTWVRSPDARDIVKSRQWALTCGLQAYARVRAELARRPYRLEPTADYVSEGCACSTTPMPPCGFCESGAGQPEGSAQ
jgi:hypothetical protein